MCASFLFADPASPQQAAGNCKFMSSGLAWIREEDSTDGNKNQDKTEKNRIKSGIRETLSLDFVFPEKVVKQFRIKNEE
jgi:hypothetical protein